MAAITLLDAGHILTTNGVHCSRSDCVLPICINSKVGNINKNSKTAKPKKRGRKPKKVRTVVGGMDNTVAMAKKRGRKPKKVKTVVDGMENTATMTENAELMLDQDMMEDLQDILARHASENTHCCPSSSSSSSFLDGMTNDAYDQGSASQPSFGQWGMQLVGNQPQSLELFHSRKVEETSRLSVVANAPFLAKGQTSHQVLSLNQPMVTHSSQFASAVPQDQNSPIISTPLITQPMNIQTSAHQGDSITGPFGYASADISRNARGGFNDQPAGTLLGILSLIFQVLDSPHTAELEEYYTSALQKALTEIQAAKCHAGLYMSKA